MILTPADFSQASLCSIDPTSSSGLGVSCCVVGSERAGLQGSSRMTRRPGVQRSPWLVSEDLEGPWARYGRCRPCVVAQVTGTERFPALDRIPGFTAHTPGNQRQLPWNISEGV